MNIEDLAPEICAAMPDALVVSDREGVIRVWNAGAERIFGFAASEAIGATLDIITPERLRARHWEGYDHTIATGQTHYGAGDLLSVPALRKDGAQISVQFSIFPLLDGDGGIAAIGAVMRDVTADFEERKRLRRAAAQT
ncbi:PAS sensor protein [Oceanicola sp. 22II-s10i]|uniref:PAS domain-containing protein n=1 Tax=Oceanicola sp. 22II-s10i TaxID=1317116 RepID=UPI000B5212FD|nr:PAS domain S-box protein [Oceanicola sp. 22II-s10i]OWU85926.1 PAS sensor protein [Oceanicola sp. 22II-s10i]